MKLKPAGYGSPNNPSESRRMFADTPVRRPGPPTFTASYDYGESAGCCGPCVDRSYLTVFDRFAAQYEARGIPATLGGDPTLTYVGLTSGLPGITDDFPYWESDTFVYTCAAGSDTYYWRMVIGASAPCRTGGGQANVYLYLVCDASATACDLTAWNCASITEVPVSQFKNIFDFRGRCGSTLNIHYPNALHEDLDDILGCEVCIRALAVTWCDAFPGDCSSGCCDTPIYYYDLTLTSGPHSGTYRLSYASDWLGSASWPQFQWFNGGIGGGGLAFNLHPCGNNGSPLAALYCKTGISASVILTNPAVPDCTYVDDLTPGVIDPCSDFTLPENLTHADFPSIASFEPHF